MNNHIDTNRNAPSVSVRPSILSDPELLSLLPRLVSNERHATAALVAHLAELDARRLYLGQGCASLFAYCMEVLHLSEWQTYARIGGARVARRFPVILEMLERGDVHLSAVGVLAPCLTEDNHRELLIAARHKSKRDVERMVAELRPRPSAPDSVRLLPIVEAPSSTTDSGTGVGTGRALAVASDLSAVVPGPIETTTPASAIPGAASSGAQSDPSRAARRGVTEPLGSGRFRVQFTASAEVIEKLRQAQDLLRHQVPDGQLGEVIDRALTALLDQLGRTKFAAVASRRAVRGAPAPASGRASRVAAQGDAELEAEHAAGRDSTPDATAPTNRLHASNSRSRHIPAEVKRQVWRRDGGCCAFIGANDRRCRSLGFLEFHHVEPFGRGGLASTENIQLRCRAHNQYEADLYYGTRSGPSWSRSRLGGSSVSPLARAKYPLVSLPRSSTQGNVGPRLDPIE